MSELTDHDWIQIEQAAAGCVSGTSDDWPDLVVAIEKVRGRKLNRKSAAWLHGYCEGLLEFKDAMKDTIACWKRTRILGVSASLACEGNVSVPLLRAFDEIREALEPKE